MIEYRKESFFPVPVSDLFQWHERDGAFARLNPPWNPVTIVQPPTSLRDGTRVVIKTPAGPFSLKWELEHHNYRNGEEFNDRLLRGPFRLWEHNHKFAAVDSSSSRLIDSIRIALPLGAGIGEWFVRREIERVFAYRHALLQSDVALHSRWNNHPKLTVLIAGASGLVGSSLAAFLSTAGHRVIRLVRRPSSATSEVAWDPTLRQIGHLPTHIDAVINLCGDSIADGRWTHEKKARIVSSRVDSTSFLAQLIRDGRLAPSVALFASAIGVYGSEREDLLDEHASFGTGFLAETGKAWEDSAKDLGNPTPRTSFLRFGVILGARGGALQKMITPFLLGVGGPLGSGSQWMSWISLQDVLGVIESALFDPRLSGPINVVSPSPITNLDFSKVLGAVLNRPAICKVPARFLKLAFGEMAQETVLSSAQVVPRKLIENGYQFTHSALEDALRFECGKMRTF